MIFDSVVQWKMCYKDLMNTLNSQLFVRVCSASKNLIDLQDCIKDIVTTATTTTYNKASRQKFSQKQIPCPFNKMFTWHINSSQSPKKNICNKMSQSCGLDQLDFDYIFRLKEFEWISDKSLSTNKRISSRNKII